MWCCQWRRCRARCAASGPRSLAPMSTSARARASCATCTPPSACCATSSTASNWCARARACVCVCVCVFACVTMGVSETIYVCVCVCDPVSMYAHASFSYACVQVQKQSTIYVLCVCISFLCARKRLGMLSQPATLLRTSPGLPQSACSVMALAGGSAPVSRGCAMPTHPQAQCPGRLARAPHSSVQNTRVVHPTFAYCAMVPAGLRACPPLAADQ